MHALSSLPIEAQDAQDARGYARAQDESFYSRQRELLGKVIADSDVVVTAAVIPGKQSPVLITEEMVKGMVPGSVIIDLAAERGGNCELDAGRKRHHSPQCEHHGPHQSGDHGARTTRARCMRAT